MEYIISRIQLDYLTSFASLDARQTDSHPRCAPYLLSRIGAYLKDLLTYLKERVKEELFMSFYLP